MRNPELYDEHRGGARAQVSSLNFCTLPMIRCLVPCRNAHQQSCSAIGYNALSSFNGEENDNIVQPHPTASLLLARRDRDHVFRAEAGGHAASVSLSADTGRVSDYLRRMRTWHRRPI
jgi:hypothetical protein